MNWRVIFSNLWVQYGVLCAAVVAPMLLPGYILTLDLVFTPRLTWPAEVSNTYVFEALLSLLNTIVPSQVIEKALLILVLLASGVGAHKLVGVLFTRVNKSYLYWGAYFAGVFYMINPFVYSRFMAGHYLVLLGYALTPFFVLSLLKFAREPGWRSAGWVGLWASAIVGVSLHYAGILLLVCVSVLLAVAWGYRKRMAKLKKLVGFGLVSLTIFIATNFYWLAPTMLGHTQISQATANFNTNEYEAFATNGQGIVGAVANVLRLQGFWVEARDMFVLPQQIVPVWGVFMLAVWLLVGAGAWRYWKINKPLTIAFGVVAVTVTVLAATPLIQWLAPYVQFVSGYREPHKFVAALALVYALLGGMGLAWLLEKLASKYSGTVLSVIVGIALVLPVVITPTMIWGFNGQLVPRNYPADWYAVDDYLSSDPAVTKVLFLPWHQYINFSFSGRIIANPAPKFFAKPTVAGDNPEFKGIEPTVPNEANRRIEAEVLSEGANTARLGERLAALGFSHVVLAKEYDHEDYKYLDAQSDLKLVNETDNLRVYAVFLEGSR